MANTPFFARNGLVVNNFLTVNSTHVVVAANLFINTSALFIGNSTVNTTHSPVLLTLQDAGSIANMSTTGFTAGTLVANTTNITMANLVVNTTVFLFGGASTINTSAFKIGSSVLNASTLTVAGTTTVNTTQIVVGGATTNVVWHAGNDGSGSGLDADTVDGVQAASFLLASSYTAADVLSKLLTVDGSGSGLDADTLDGVNSTAFLLVANPVATGTLTAGATTVNTTHIYVGGGSSNIVWHAGNDGAGSGLDADLLDGQSSAFYLAASSYTAADVLSKLLTVDGSGSGLDADLLDGQSSAAFQAAIGYTTVNKAGDTMSGTLNVGANVNISTSRIQVGNSTVNASINATAFALNGVAIGDSSALPPGFVSILYNPTSGAANTKCDFVKGKARSSDDTVNIVLASTINKRLDAAWAVGSAAGGLDTGARASNQFYYLWVIRRSDTGVVDGLFSLSATSPTMPANYDAKQRIGWVRTDGSSNIREFFQSVAEPDLISYVTPIFDVNAANLGNTAGRRLYTLTAPPNSIAYFRFTYADSYSPCTPPGPGGGK
jgi:hypothetical protein